MFAWPSGMNKIVWVGLLKWYEKRILIIDGGMQILTLTLALLGMIALKEVQETQNTGFFQINALSIGPIRWKTKTNKHDWKLITQKKYTDSRQTQMTENWLNTDLAEN